MLGKHCGDLGIVSSSLLPLSAGQLNGYVNFSSVKVSPLFKICSLQSCGDCAATPSHMYDALNVGSCEIYITSQQHMQQIHNRWHQATGDMNRSAPDMRVQNQGSGTCLGPCYHAPESGGLAH